MEQEVKTEMQWTAIAVTHVEYPKGCLYADFIHVLNCLQVCNGSRYGDSVYTVTAKKPVRPECLKTHPG